MKFYPPGPVPTRAVPVPGKPFRLVTGPTRAVLFCDAFRVVERREYVSGDPERTPTPADAAEFIERVVDPACARRQGPDVPATVRGAFGDILESGASAVVVPVNTQGTMGAGLARHAALAFPAAVSVYRGWCRDGTVAPGTAPVVPVAPGLALILVVTKKRWRDDSTLDLVGQGIAALAATVAGEGFSHVAVPALGCGLGRLDWDVVRPLIVDAMASVRNGLLADVYEPW